MSTQRSACRLFDAHCHLQDPRIRSSLRTLISQSKERGVQWFAVNGTSEADWDDVRQLAQDFPEVIPNFGLHPWYVAERSPLWLAKLRALLEEVPGAGLGEAGLDKGRVKQVDMDTQLHVLRQQLELARELGRPASLHCVRAHAELDALLREMGPFPSGLLLHSYSGSAEMVRQLAVHGAYFSFSGFLTWLKPNKAAQVLAQVPMDRLLLETDAPDARPRVDTSLLLEVPDWTDALAREGDQSSSAVADGEDPSSGVSLAEKVAKGEEGSVIKEGEKGGACSSMKELNHPANVTVVLNRVATALGKDENETGVIAYENALRLFSFAGSVLHPYNTQ